MTQPPMTSSIQVSEEAVRAGDAVLKRADFSFWEKMEEAEGHALIRDIYLAMKAAEPLPQGDELIEASNALIAALDSRNELADIQPAIERLRAALVRSKPDDVREALIEALAEMLACSRTGGVHFAVEPEPSSVDTSFALRNEAHAMSAILTAIHPTDEEGCFVHKRPVSVERLQEIIALADRYREARTAIGSQSIEGERG